MFNMEPGFSNSKATKVEEAEPDAVTEKVVESADVEDKAVKPATKKRAAKKA